MQYADIIVDISNENLDKTYQYLVPEELIEKAVPGTPVFIPFGKGNRQIKGYIISLSSESKVDPSIIKPITSIIQGELAIENQLIALAAWIRQNYGATMNEALHTVIPVKRKIKEAEQRTVLLCVTKEEAKEAQKVAQAKHYVAKSRLLLELIETQQLPYEIVTGKLNIKKSTIESLQKAGIICVERKRLYRNPISKKEAAKPKKILNEEQQIAVDSILSDYRQGIHKTYLLYGVTGSGKTEVYLDIIQGVIESGKQVILLIPEIALTYQTVKRFGERFGERISILNSRMSQGERSDQSERAKNGEIDIMIGPRSALFTPFQNLGMIIIDEEHEASYKSEMPPKYHTRETAIERARLANASVLLGSATPSLEAFYQAKIGNFKLFTMKKRAKEAELPTIHVIDLREELKQKNKSMFSTTLKELIKQRLEKKQQIMLFLNRRGYAGFVSCRSCGHVMKCPHCDISLTSHNNGTLVCHYCGYEEKMPALCPACNSKYIAAFGIGTQKVEELVHREFPNARVLRMDADTTKSKDSHEEILSTFANQEADILIGTQMIVKGHDFEAVTLVGVLAADLSLYASDYRAAERTYQLLSQAAGRAGRGKFSGEVVIQTYNPEHYSILCAANNDYEGFFQRELAYRNAMLYPPVGHILVILILSKEERKGKEASELFTAAAEDFIKNCKLDEQTQIIGPTPARLTKANDVYRHVIYIKQTDYAILVEIKNFLELYLLHSKRFSGCNIQFDFDPISGY